MSDILNEIKEDLQREKYEQLWNKYGFILIILVVLIVASTAGGIWWKKHLSSQQQKVGNSFYNALSLEIDDRPKAIALLGEIRQQNIKGFSGLAGIKEAEITIKNGQADKAGTIYNDVSANKKNDPAIRDLAALLATSRRVSSGTADGTDDKVLAELAAKDRPWRYSALELQGIKALHLGNKQAAKEYFTTLSKEPFSPEGLRTRAEQILVVINETATDSGSKK